MIRFIIRDSSVILPIKGITWQRFLELFFQYLVALLLLWAVSKMVGMSLYILISGPAVLELVYNYLFETRFYNCQRARFPQMLVYLEEGRKIQFVMCFGNKATKNRSVL